MEIKAGKFIALPVKTEAGKSTLIKIISGVYTPDSGEIHFGDKVYED